MLGSELLVSAVVCVSRGLAVTFKTESGTSHGVWRISWKGTWLIKGEFTTRAGVGSPFLGLLATEQLMYSRFAKCFHRAFLGPDNSPASMDVGGALIVWMVALRARKAVMCPNPAHSPQGCWGHALCRKAG